MHGYIRYTYTAPQQEVHMVFGFWIPLSPGMMFFPHSEKNSGKAPHAT